MRLRVDFNYINSLCSNPQNDQVLCGGNGLWTVDVEKYTVNQIDTKPVNSIDILNHMITGTGHIIKLWDLTTTEVINTYHVNHNGVNDHIHDIKFINPRCFVTGGNNCNLSIFDINNSNRLYELNISNDNISCLQVKDDKVYASSYDGKLSITDLRMDKLVQYQFNAVLIKFKLHKQFLVSLTDQSEVLIFDFHTGTIVNQYKISGNLDYIIDLDVIHTNKTFIYIGSQESQVIKIEWDTQRHLLVNKQQHQVESDIICNVTVKNSKVISTSNDGFVYIFENF